MFKLGIHYLGTLKLPSSLLAKQSRQDGETDSLERKYKGRSFQSARAVCTGRHIELDRRLRSLVCFARLLVCLTVDTKELTLLALGSSNPDHCRHFSEFLSCYTTNSSQLLKFNDFDQ